VTEPVSPHHGHAHLYDAWPGDPLLCVPDALAALAPEDVVNINGNPCRPLVYVRDGALVLVRDRYGAKVLLPEVMLSDEPDPHPDLPQASPAVTAADDEYDTPEGVL